MLYLDVIKACNNKGIEDPRRWMVKNGFSHVAAARLLHHTQGSINYNTLETLCLLLFCTPNELLSWQPKDHVNTIAKHPMEKLKHIASEASINGRLKTMTPEKLEAIQKFMDDLATQ